MKHRPDLKDEINKIIYNSKYKYDMTDKIIKFIEKNEDNVITLENPINIKLLNICKNNLNDLLKYTKFTELRKIKRRLKNIIYKIEDIKCEPELNNNYYINK